jgi:glycosyltransferase involved in cell wall biosynthesis
MADIDVVILTYNEEIHIERVLSSVAAFARRVFVIDSYSADRTVEIARASGAIVLQNHFINHARQFKWALDNAPISAGWTMRLDADEVVESDLAQFINQSLSQLPGNVVGINLKRKHIFLERWIKHGGRYPLILLRIWRTGKGRIEQRWMDEHMTVWGGRTITLDGGFSDHNLNDLTFFTNKHNKYATREAVDVIAREMQLLPQDTGVWRSSTCVQTSIKRVLKEKVYGRLPYQVRALGYFLFRYIFQAGFLDGIEGVVCHFLQAFWYRFLVGAKVSELRSALSKVEGVEERKAELARLTALNVGVMN